MKKKIEIEYCFECPFNAHGIEEGVPIMETYLGKIIRVIPGTDFGGPMLYCTYNPKVSFRDNVRNNVYPFHWNRNFIICIGGREQFQGEFERQLNGFPRRCPLKESE